MKYLLHWLRVSPPFIKGFCVSTTLLLGPKLETNRLRSLVYRLKSIVTFHDNNGILFWHRFFIYWLTYKFRSRKVEFTNVPLPSPPSLLLATKITNYTGSGITSPKSTQQNKLKVSSSYVSSCDSESLQVIEPVPVWRDKGENLIISSWIGGLGGSFPTTWFYGVNLFQNRFVGRGFRALFFDHPSRRG